MAATLTFETGNVLPETAWAWEWDTCDDEYGYRSRYSFLAYVGEYDDVKVVSEQSGTFPSYDDAVEAYKWMVSLLPERTAYRVNVVSTDGAFLCTGWEPANFTPQ